MSQEGEGSTIGQGDRSTGSGSATHDDSTIATAGSTISNHETAPGKVPDGRTKNKLCENIIEKDIIFSHRCRGLPGLYSRRAPGVFPDAAAMVGVVGCFDSSIDSRF